MLSSLNPEVERLLREKSFEQLTANELEQVLQLCSESEFRYFQAILASAANQQYAGPSERVAQRLQQAMRRRSWLRQPLHRAAHLQVPAWLAAAVLLLAVGAFQYWQRPTNSSVMPVAAAKTDTLFLTRFIRDTLFLAVPAAPVAAAAPVESMVHTLATLDTSYSQLVAATFGSGLPAISRAPVDSNRPKGYTLRDDSIYMKLMGVVR